MIRTLIFDQAKQCGWALFDEDRLIDYGVERLGCDKTAYEKILLPAYEFAKNLIDKTKADRIVIEGIQCQSNLATYRKLALLQGVLICLFVKNNYPYSIVEPSKWKSFCEIKGKKRQEQKENTIKFVKDRFDIDVSSDAADAICMGVWSVNSGKEM